MKFREHGDLEPIVVTAESPEALTARLEELSAVFDFIDLQYSTTTLVSGAIHYSALVLASQRNEKENAK